MTIEKFFGTLKLVLDLDSELRLQTALDAVDKALNSLVAMPAHPPHQASLGSALEALNTSVASLRDRLAPSEFQSIAELGGREYFDPSIAEKVTASVGANAMTPSVARNFVKDLAERRSEYLTTLKQTLDGLEELGVSGGELKAGTADLAFVIPRDLFANHLEPFAKELVFINRLIQHYGEAVTAKVEPVELQQLSSSVPTVALIAAPKIIEAIANAVTKFLDAWEKIEKIRRIRCELKDMGLKVEALDQLTEQITTTVDEVVEESTQLTLKGYKGEPTRRNELENALKQDTRRLFGQIERGLTIQFRAAPAEKAEKDQQGALEAVDKIGRVLQFPTVKAEPMLLKSGQILEGDLVVTHTSKKKTNTTTVKKAVSKNTTQ